MSFLAILISYFLQQKLDLSLSGKFDAITLDVLRPRELSLSVMTAGAAPILVLLIAAAYFSITYTVFFYIEHLFWGLLSFLGEVAILLLLVGQKGFKERLGLYLDAWNRGDFEAAAFKQQGLSGTDARRLEDPAMMQNEVCKALLYHNFNRFFVIVFWFVVGGAGAAVAFRVVDLISLNASRRLRGAAMMIKNILEWVPVRVLMLSFVVTDDFKGALGYCRRYLTDVRAEASRVLYDTASGALSRYDLNHVVDSAMSREMLIERGKKGVAAIRGLLNRSMALWLGLIAIAVILGW